MLDPGKLRHRIDIQAKTGTADDGFGHSVVNSTWVDVYPSIAALIQPKSAKEQFTAKEVQSNTTHTVTMRFQTGVTSAMRIVYGTRIFTISGITDNEERNNWLVIDCLEQTT